VMVEKWQELIDASEFPDIAVFGVMNESLARIKEFHESTRLTFPIYCDTGKVFENEHYVIDFPLQVAVGRSGTILSHTVDARAPVEISALVALMAQ
jgi:peroxiredoxin